MLEIDNTSVTSGNIDKEYIKTLIYDILDKHHSNPYKKRIIEHPDRLNFACPICGDSEKDNHKKRGNLYFKNMLYICYNDESCKRSFTKFLDTFGIKMDIDEKIKLYEYLEQNIHFKTQGKIEISSLDKLIPIDKIFEHYCGNTKNRGLSLVRPLTENSKVYNHIKFKRKIYNPVNIYEGEYYITPTWKQEVMVFINQMDDKVISLQTRNLLDGNKRMFDIKDFSKLYSEIFPTVELDEQEKISYDKLSHFFNIFNIDFSETVTLFEGYVDSLFLPNSIGMIGINTDFSFLTKEEGLDLRFLYDNDESGFKKSEKMLMDGYTVFLWNKLFLDILKKYNGNKLEMCYNLMEIKDFNSFYLKSKKPLYKMFNLAEYFSNNKLDSLYFFDLDVLYKKIKL